ncbi:MAG: hypothetical protein BRC58_04185 [Cyanobacteria bacterium QS_8_64_29]|nr:MAG: hypothetical protein BRC58_04185 [Cyanobacteria bacterium QS_8_64_29]
MKPRLVLALARLKRSKLPQVAGFTLIELLVAAAMGSIVVAATGIGLMAILRSDARSENLTRQRTELSRALDFIGEETKMATAIGSSGSEPGEFDCNNASGVLTLDIPSVDPKIVYYTKPVSSDSNWLSPESIYRWGPSFDGGGEYGNPSNPDGWNCNLLVDSIASDGFQVTVNGTREAELVLEGKMDDETYKVETTVFARAQ